MHLLQFFGASQPSWGTPPKMDTALMGALLLSLRRLAGVPTHKSETHPLESSRTCETSRQH
jgi:hypothetical protein